MPTKIEKDEVTGTETTGHEWDGIKELNTPLPQWWLYIFYACIAWSVVYMLFYPAIPTLSGHSGGLMGYDQRLDIEAEMETSRAREQAYLHEMAAADLSAIRTDPRLQEIAYRGGAAAFADNCVACHALGGAGQYGYPSLADDVWIWGGKLEDIHQTLLVGIRHEPENTRSNYMPAFGKDGILTRDQIEDVADYVMSLSMVAGDREALEEPTLFAIERGAGVYEAQCVVCHMDGGSGNQELGAPRLNDAVWLYGGDKASIVSQIHAPSHGVMPAWQERLSPETIKMLTVYVHTLGGGE